MASSGNPVLLQAAPIAQAAARFLRWWRAELAALVPARLRAWWRGGDKIVLLSLEAGRALFDGEDDGRRERVLAIDLDPKGLAAPGTDVARQLARRVGDGYRLMLSLPAARTLRRTLTLPLATEENLRQTLSFELDRYTPFKPDQVHFDFRIRGRDEARRQIEVDLAVVRRADVEPQLQAATALGLRVHGLAFGSDILGGGGSFDSRASDDAGNSRRAWWRIGAGLLAVALLTILLAVPLWQKRTAAIALLAPLAQARLAAQETDGLRDRLGKLAEEHNALPDKKWATQSMLVILEELSARLKDDTYVTLLEFDGKTVTMHGESASAAALVEVLEASPVFRNVAFKSQLTKLQGTAYDRFHIGFELKPEGLPKPPAGESAPIAATTATPTAVPAAPPPAAAPPSAPMPAPAPASPPATSVAPAPAKDAPPATVTPPATPKPPVSGQAPGSAAISAGPVSAPAPSAGPVSGPGPSAGPVSGPVPAAGAKGGTGKP